MEDRPHIAFWRRIKEADPLWGIIIAAACVRFYYSYHRFLSDEIFNLIIIEKLVTGGGYGDYFFRHPPLYLLLSALTSWIIGVYPQVPSFISIIFSSLSIMPLYRITEYLMGRRIAIWASVFFAVMPSNFYYSAWIKQDAMLLFFFLSSIYLYLNKRYFLAGVFTGVSLLTKEFAVFIFPLSFFITAFAANRDRKWYGWLLMSAVALIISLWWYVLFGTVFYQVTGDALIGGNMKELVWHFPWWFYFKNMPHDLSYPFLFFLIIGIAVLVAGIIFRDTVYTAKIILLLWIGIFYVPLSLVTVKAPWYIYLATPSLSIVAAYGFVKAIDITMSKAYKVGVYLTISISIASILFSFDEHKYIEKLTGFTHQKGIKAIQGKNWDEFFGRLTLWRGKIKGEGKIGCLEFIPTLQYMMGIRDDKVVVIGVSRFMALDRKGLLKFVRDEEIKGIVLNVESLTYTEENLRDMISLWGEPENVDSLLLFRTYTY